MISTSLFSSNGSIYNQAVVFTPPNFQLNQTALNEVGLPALTGSNAWAGLMSSLAIGGLVAHCIFFWGPSVISSFKHTRDNTQPDPHWVAMQKYKEAPWWWYISLLVLAFFAGECMRRHYPAHTSDVIFRVLHRSYQRAQGRDDVACLVLHCCPYFRCDRYPVLDAPIRTYGCWHRDDTDFQNDCWCHQSRKACCESLCERLDYLLPWPLK